MTDNATHKCFDGTTFGEYSLHISILAGLLIIFESVVVITVICRNNQLRRRTNIFVASMAVNDMLVSVSFICSRAGLLRFGTFSAHENNIIDCFMFGNSYGAIFMSTIHMGVIAIDRYIHISYPFWYMRNSIKKAHTFLILLCMWTTGLVFIFGPLLLYTDDRYHQLCIILRPPVVYFCVFVFLSFVIFITVLVCYFAIARVAFKHKRAANARRLHIQNHAGDILIRNNFLAAMKSIKFFATMFGFFSACTLPPILTSAILFFYDVPKFIYMAVSFLIPINAIVNLVIYATMNNDFS